MNTMTSKQRVHAALKRQPVDRVPIFMWFHPATAQRLARMLEIPVSYVSDAFGNDIRQTWVNNNYAMEGIIHEFEGESHVDYWGIRWTKVGYFNQISLSPLANADRSEVLRYHFPEEHIESLLAKMESVVTHANQYFIGCDVSPCVFEMYCRLRGMEGAMLDMVSDPDLADVMLSRCADFAVKLSVEASQRFALDWLWSGDDVSGQSGMLMSPRTWRKLIKPHLRRVFEVGKSNGLWVAHHCCGGLRPIIGDLVEIGLDVLNPVQCNCPGMDPLELKAEFGKYVTFMGGVDTQYLLPHGSVTEVRRAIARLLQGMSADGGGYILAPSHTIPPETPDDNIFAMYEEAGITRETIFDKAADIRRRIGSGE